MPRTEPELVIDAHAIIGESPVWSATEGALYWADIKGHRLHRLDPVTGATRDWDVPSDLGGYALLPDGSGAVVALRSGLFEMDFARGRLTHLADPPFDPRTHRFNESGIDPAGRLWLGEMADPLPGVELPPTKGRLHSFTRAGGLVTHEIGAYTANGFAWSGDGKTFMLAHTEEGQIEAIAFDAAAGTLGLRRVFARIDPKIGQPDGATFDGEGYYWIAIHKGGRLHRYAPDGTLDRVVRFPVDNPTMPAFVGPDLDVMYVTSATHGNGDAARHEGGLFRFRPDVAGQAIAPFMD